MAGQRLGWPGRSLRRRRGAERRGDRARGCRLRREHDVLGGIPVLLSTERPRCQLVSMVDMQEGNPLDYQVSGKTDRQTGRWQIHG